MSGVMIATAGFSAMLALIALRMPVGLAMLVVGSAGYTYFAGPFAFLNYVKSTPYHLFANYSLSVIPLFILMGAFAERSGLAADLFKAARAFIGHRRGGLAYALIGACTGFGAICGSSVATTATFGRATLPEFRRYGYDMGFATSAIAAGGTLGILIPPSVILVVYALATEQNIAKLFNAALVPGLLAALFYCIVIFLVTRARPDVAAAMERMPWGERWPTLVSIIPAIVVVIVVLGGINGLFEGPYRIFGFQFKPGLSFTPTEGASVGCIIMLLVGIVRRRIGSEQGLGWAEIRASFLQTAETAAMIFLILLGAEVFNGFLALTKLPANAAEMVAGLGLPPYAIVAILMVFYVILGGVMDELAMIMLTLPVFFPVVTALDFGIPPEDVPIWFGILVLIVVGVGLTAPPIGLNVFVICSLARDVPIIATYRGVLPFIAADAVRLGLIVTFPALALWLVRLLN
jgi:tripartite ATP-independent transporter DctM subunit